MDKKKKKIIGAAASAAGVVAGAAAGAAVFTAKDTENAAEDQLQAENAGSANDSQQEAEDTIDNQGNETATTEESGAAVDGDVLEGVEIVGDRHAAHNDTAHDDATEDIEDDIVEVEIETEAEAGTDVAEDINLDEDPIVGTEEEQEQDVEYAEEIDSSDDGGSGDFLAQLGEKLESVTNDLLGKKDGLDDFSADNDMAADMPDFMNDADVSEF